MLKYMMLVSTIQNVTFVNFTGILNSIALYEYLTSCISSCHEYFIQLCANRIKSLLH